MHGIQQKIADFFEKNIQIASDDTLILGVSGGADSMAMLHILHQFSFKCVVAHCNFHLRGSESDADEKLVQAFTQKHQLPFEKIDFNTTKYAKEHKQSVEMAARTLRYQWFEFIRQKHHARYIAVAHHSDDSVETLLINLIRGTGIRGLKGIEPLNGNVIRPMLSCTRIEIDAYNHSHCVPFAIDCTNADTDIVRNKIRWEVLPKLAEINPSIKRTLFETTDKIQGVLKIFEHQIAKIKLEITHIKNGNLYIEIEKLKLQPDVRTVLFEVLYPYHFHPDVLTQVAESLEAQSGSQFLSSEYVLIKDRKYLILSPLTSVDFQEIAISETTLSVAKPVALQLSIFDRNKQFEVSKHKKIAQLDVSKLHFPLVLRKWEIGDKFIPLGMKQLKKISDFLIDNKVDVLQKRHTYVLVSDNEIVWVVGMRIDNRFKITEKTSRILEIKC